MHKKLLTQLCYANGLFNLKTGLPVNITKKPTPVDKRLFEEIKNIQTDLQDLYLRLSQDLEAYSFEDPLYKFLHSIKRRNRIKSFYLRSDYLLDSLSSLDSSLVYKQVEINLISQCFSVFGPIVNRIHSLVDPRTVLSDSDEKFINYLISLKKEFERIYQTNSTAMAMVDNDTSPSSSNYLEKMMIIKMCLEKGLVVHHVKIEDLSYEKESVFYKGQEISIIYFRWFYNFDHYDSSSKEARGKIESSRAVSLPSAEFQIINSKAFQKILADEEVLKKYTGKSKEILRHFGEFKGREEGMMGEKEMMGEGWILKDVNEGGGHLNNFKDSSPSSSSFWMKKFVSPSFPNSFLLDDTPRKVISEVSIFGGLINVDGETVYNEEGGYMVRSKDEGSLEGGVCIGAGGLDSIFFQDE